jgi:hypothetical protein
MLSRALAFFLALFALLGVATPRTARAQSLDPEEVATSPRDAPLVLQPDAVKLPPLPSDFVVRDEGWLVIEYPPGVSERVQPLIAQANDVRTKLTDDLGEAVLDRVEVRVARNPDEMTMLAPLDYPPFPYASAMAYTRMHLVLLSMQAPVSAEATDLEETFRHELAHVALEDAVAGHHVPRWFTEGLAIHESGEASWTRWKTLWDATLSNQVMPLS